MYSLVDIASVKNIQAVSKIQYTELFGFAIKITSVSAEKCIAGRFVVIKQDVNTATDRLVMALCCTGKLRKGRHAQEPTVRVGNCQLLNIQSRGAALDTTEAEGETNASVAFHPRQCLGSSKQERYLGSTEP